MSEKSVEVKLEAVSPAVTHHDDNGFPEGGWQAWSTLFGASLVQFSTFGYTNAFGVYQGCHRDMSFLSHKLTLEDFYVRDYLTKYTPSDIGWIGGVQIFMIFSAGIVTGRAFDRGYFHHLMIGGAILHSFSFFMLSLSHENQYYQVFLSQALGGGIASGIVYIPSLAVVSHYFQRHRPLAMGIVSVGTALGAVLHPIMLNKLFHGPIGFHNGVRISASLNSALLILANLMMRTRLPPRKTGSIMAIREFFRDPPYVFAVIGGLFVICGLFFPVFFLQLDAVKHGVDPEFAFYCISILNASSIVGRIIPAMLAPRYGVFNLLIFFTFCMGALIFCLGAVKSMGGIAAFAVVFGFCSGGGITLTPPMLASLAKDMGEIGARIGVSFAISGIVGLFAIPIAGALLTSNFHWWHPIIFAGATMIIGAGLFGASRFLLAQKKGAQYV